MLYKELHQYLKRLDFENIKDDRKRLLIPLLAYLQGLHHSNQAINLNFICTHNSRRSHLAQCWAQAIAYDLGLGHVHAYSGGTEATAVFSEVLHVLKEGGFQTHSIATKPQPIHAIKYSAIQQPILSFSKKYDDFFNPSTDFVAIMVCSDAEQKCPFVHGAAARFAIPFEDPKMADGTSQQTQAYQERSQQIATELLYVFSQIATS